MNIGSEKKDYIWTSIATAWTVLMNVVVYNLLVRVLGEVGFSEYVIGRRAISFLIVLLFLGMGVALPRQLAMRKEGSQVELGYMLGATICIIPGLFLAVAAISTLPGQFSLILFGEPGHEKLVIALGVFLWALSVNALVYSFFRGLMRFKDAAVLAGVTASIVPLVVFVSDSASDVFFFAAGLTLLTDTIYFLYVSKQLNNSKNDILSTARKETRLLANYGLPRVPGDVALQALLIVPILIANYAFSLSIGSFIAFSLVFISLTNTVLSPLSFVLLPRVTVILRDRKFADAGKDIETMLAVTIGISLLVTVAIVFGAKFVVFEYLLMEDIRAVAILRIVSVSIPPYAVYSVLRSIVDAADKRPLNAYNLYLAFAGFLLVATLGWMFWSDNILLFVAAIPVSFCILGVSTYVTLRRVARAIP